MKGAGYYDRHSTAQHATIQALQDWIDDAVKGVPLPTCGQPVTILDLGSSEGRNAVRMMRTIVAGLRRRTEQPLRTIYSDLASNNFNQLFANLEEAHGRFPEGVYPSAVGGSFYYPLLPPGTVHVATSFNSIHWLDRLPDVSVPDFVAYRRPQPHRESRAASPEVTNAFKRQADNDLVRFLDCRANELVPGGKLLLAAPGDSLGSNVGNGFADVLNDACLDLVACDCLQRNEYERLTLPCYFRTVTELLAPLEQEGSPVKGAFSVDRAEALDVQTPFFMEFQDGGDVLTYADAYTGFMRAVTEPVVKAALKRRGADAETVERLYERIQARLVDDPVRYRFRYVLVAALLTRV
jgi:hypothetical protein